MGHLINIWREVSSYLRYANSRNLALITINASLLTLLTAALSTTAENAVLTVIRPSLTCYEIICSFIAISQLVLLISFAPTLNRFRRTSSAWTSLCRHLRLVGSVVLPEQRNPFYFFEIDQFNNAPDYFAHLATNYKELIGEDPQSPALMACSQQIWTISRICTTKFAQFSLALALLTIAIVIYAIYVLWNLRHFVCQTSLTY
jgi:hypothetical protein